MATSITAAASSITTPAISSHRRAAPGSAVAGFGSLPYHESDHVLNLAYNVLCGGTRLEDIDRLRHDTAYMNALGAALHLATFARYLRPDRRPKNTK